MKLITLLENQKESKKLKNKHGLSFYIESNGNKIIFDRYYYSTLAYSEILENGITKDLLFLQ